ncbi:hypothetical protein SEPCBS119000_002985 [Sporothrix epigloea]|uniref:Uncharacterized protein n=1 Tax=Sporothrix epigloea TaxID=1892477 RepID=A0ABP0DND9_9PEZI
MVNTNKDWRRWFNYIKAAAGDEWRHFSPEDDYVPEPNLAAPEVPVIELRPPLNLQEGKSAEQRKEAERIYHLAAARISPAESIDILRVSTLLIFTFTAISTTSDKSAHEAKGMAEAPSADLVAKKTAMVQELIKDIEASTQANEDLIDILLHDFPGWETDDFAAVKGPVLSELRTLFMRRGVYVKKKAIFARPKCFADIVVTRDIAPRPDSAIKTLVL